MQGFGARTWCASSDTSELTPAPLSLCFEQKLNESLVQTYGIGLDDIASRPAPVGGQKLGPEWEVRLSKSKGTSYYFNKLTGQSQWHPPVMSAMRKLAMVHAFQKGASPRRMTCEHQYTTGTSFGPFHAHSWIFYFAIQCDGRELAGTFCPTARARLQA